jgi:membrane protease YdiL (CAAX protease family)
VRDPHPSSLSPALILAVLGLALVSMIAALEGQVLVRALLAGESAAVAQAAVSRDPGALALAQLVGLAIPIGLALRLRGEGVGAFLSRALAPCPWDRVAAAALAGLALQLPLVEVTHRMALLVPALARSPEEEARLREVMRLDSVYAAICVPLAVVVLAPVTEELLFRALAQRDLAERWGVRAALPVVAALFAGFHLDPLAAPAIAGAGLCLGALAARWGTVRIGIAMHAGVNAVPVLLTDAVVPIPGFNTEDDAGVPPVLLLASAAIFVVCFGWALRRPAAGL